LAIWYSDHTPPDVGSEPATAVTIKHRKCEQTILASINSDKPLKRQKQKYFT
jgi:hypothetical protein